LFSSWFSLLIVSRSTVNIRVFSSFFQSPSRLDGKWFKFLQDRPERVDPFTELAYISGNELRTGEKKAGTCSATDIARAGIPRSQMVVSLSSVCSRLLPVSPNDAWNGGAFRADQVG
jgi:hypothetical protein